MNKKVKEYSILTILTLALAYFTRHLFVYIAGMIASSFINVLYTACSVVTSLVSLIAIFTYLSHKYVKKLEGVKKYIYTILCSVLSLVGLIFYFATIKLQFSNLFNGIDMNLVAIFNPIALVTIIVVSIMFLLNKKEDNEARLLANIKGFKKVGLVVLGLLAGYSLASSFINLLCIANIKTYAFGYIALGLMFLLMIFNFTSNIYNEYNYSKKLKMINLIANAIIVLLFVLAEIIKFDLLVLIGKPFCPADFAISIAFLPIFTIIGLVTNLLINVLKK